MSYIWSAHRDLSLKTAQLLVSQGLQLVYHKSKLQAVVVWKSQNDSQSIIKSHEILHDKLYLNLINYTYLRCVGRVRKLSGDV